MRWSLPVVLLAAAACGRSSSLQPRQPGPAPACALSVEPTSVDFGTVQPGAHVDAELVLHNEGDATCQLTRVALQPDSDPAFSVDGVTDGALDLAPGDDAVLTLTYAPQRAEAPFSRTGALGLDTNDPQQPHVDVPLQAALPRCHLQLAPDSLEFGGVGPGEPADRPLTLTNSGDGTCTLSNAAIAPDSDPGFSLAPDGFAASTVAPGGEVTITARFEVDAAADPAERRGTLTFTTNDADQPSVQVPLHAELQFCDLTVSPDPFDFGNVVLDATVTDQLTLTNHGLARCNIREIALTPDTDPGFSLPGVAGLISMPAEDTDTIAVRFAALDSAPPHQRTGTLTFTTDDPNHPQFSVPLSAFVNTVCTQAGQYIYTVDENANFSRFDPVARTSEDIGVLQCPTSAKPFSMHVDQSAIAWVLFDDAKLYRVDTADASCTATSYVPDQHDLRVFGMGSTFDSSTGRDTLYIAGEQLVGATSSTLATLDLNSFTVSPIGRVDVGNVELAGTADGQLWAFAPAPSSASGQPVLAQLDRTSAATIESYDVSGITSQGGFAMKFFGGAFYVFVGADVWKVDRSALVPGEDAPTSAPELVFTNPGRDVVGAGVSTCAPVQ